MKFQFQDLGDFMTMSGHGVYVWGCYLLAAVIVSLLTLAPVLRRRRYLKELIRRERIAQQQALQQSI